MSRQDNRTDRRKRVEEYANIRHKAYAQDDFNRSINTILTFDAERIKADIRAMYDAVDYTDGEKSAKILYVLEYIYWLYAEHNDEYTPEELVYYICRQLNNNLRIVSNNPSKYWMEEELIMTALKKFNHKIGDFRRRPPHEVPEYVTDNTPFDFYYINN